MLNLMVASPGQGGKMPLYLHTAMRILRELRIKQQQRGGGFDYQEFKNAMKAEKLTKEQSGPLRQRLETLESFMVKQNAPTEGPENKKGKGKAAPMNQDRIDWTPVVCQTAILFGSKLTSCVSEWPADHHRPILPMRDGRASVLFVRYMSQSLPRAENRLGASSRTG
jgi:hypothetical protein